VIKEGDVRHFISAAFLTMLLAPGIVLGQNCDDYTQYTRWITRAAIQGEAYGIDVVGNYAYVTNIQALSVGIEILDISDPYYPVSVGFTPYPGRRSDIEVSGNYAYVATGDGLEVIDVDDPTDPFVVGSVSTPGAAGRLAVSGDYAYVTNSDSGLVVVDVSVDSLPMIVGGIKFTNYVSDVAIQGDYAYLASFREMRIVDITTPSAPVLVGTLPISPGYATSVGVSGDYAYLGRTSTDNGFYVVDVTDPSAPAFVGDVQGFNVYEFVLDGALAYLCTSDLRIVDISDPTNPEELVHIVTKGDDVAVANGYAYLGGGHILTPEVQVVELGVHAAPAPLGSYGADLDVDFHDFDAKGSIAYAVGKTPVHDRVLHSIDLSTPSSLQMLDSLTLGQSTHLRDVSVDGGTAVIALGNLWEDDELHIVDVSAPSAMSVAGSTAVSPNIRRTRVKGDYVYVTASGLRVFDISSPATPTQVGSITLSGANGLDVAGSMVYVAAGQNRRIQVVDVTTPSNPILRGAIDGYNLDYIVVRGNYVYSAGYYIFVVADISDPDAPFVVATQYIPGGDAQGISEENNIVSVVMSRFVLLIDVTSPSSPAVVGSTEPTISNGEVVADGGVIIAMSIPDGLYLHPGHCGQPIAINDAAPSNTGAGLTIWPNPFNPSTTIRFEVPSESQVSLRIYDVSGRLVRALVEGRRDARVHEVSWDGTDNAGRRVASGVYFCQLNAGSSVEVRKTVLLK